jgi:NADH dehydrogenase (ubiquinone) Fe-S protein 1
MNSKVRGVEDADLLLLIGTNPKIESPVFNARIRKAVIKNNLSVGLIGSPHQLSYEYDHVGTNVKSLIDILDGKHPFSARIANAKLPMMIVGSSVFERTDGEDLYKLCLRLSSKFINKEKKWNGFNILHRDVANIGALDIGIKLHTKSVKNPKLVYLLNCDDYIPSDIPEDAFVIYQGTHGDRGAERANIILPGSTYVEKQGTYVSTDGRVDCVRSAMAPPYLARPDWEIIRALSEFLGVPLPYDEIYDLRNRMCELAPHLIKYDYCEPHGFEDLLLKTFENDDITVNNTNLVDVIDVTYYNIEFLYD